ncbi:MAG TPA: hypothetical protein VGR90_08385 [Acidimicrobiales bacterium]|nr:hypothetical protein [Acidimicrobiales bacterium]
MWRPGPERTDTTELRRIVRDELDLGDDDVVTVTERACPKQGCPPVETVISVFPAEEDSYMIRVCKAIGDVEPMDVIAALAWGEHPNQFDPRSLL